MRVRWVNSCIVCWETLQKKSGNFQLFQLPYVTCFPIRITRKVHLGMFKCMVMWKKLVEDMRR